MSRNGRSEARRHNASRRQLRSLARGEQLYAPIDVGFFGPDGVMLCAEKPADAIEQFRRGCDGSVRGGHDVDLAAFAQRSKVEKRAAEQIGRAVEMLWASAGAFCQL